MLITPGYTAKIQADTAHTIKNIGREKQALKYLWYNFSRFPQKYNNRNNPKAGRKNAWLSVEIQAGAGIPTEDYLNTYVASGFGLTIHLKKKLSLSFDLGYWRSTAEEVPDKFHDGHLKAFPLLASLQFFLSRQNRGNPYLFLGGGYIFCSFEMENIITIPEITIDQSVKNGPCLEGGLGIDVPLSRTLGVFAEAFYFYRKTSGITTITDLNFGKSTREFPLNLQAWIFQIGIKYFIK
jgi:hypothetical protein